ncbi:MAG TPA: cation diffusion facilitator family transporter [Arenimonas sp.]|nr:cation diffusion facilitator family transporter [Arenimonas sp.]
MHSHSHHHNHQSKHHVFAWAMWINLGYSLLEAGFGFYTNSLALISDALHNLGDAAGLGLAWGAAWLASHAPTERHTFGWRRATQLSPLMNAILLVAFSGALLWESFRRMHNPPEVPGLTLMWVAGIGILVNVGTAALFYRGQHSDLNKRGAFLHLMADAAVSVAVVIAGVGLWLYDWRWLDPVTSLLVAIVVGISSWRLLKESFMQVMDAVPGNLDKSQIETYLLSLPGVTAVHHVHIWSIGAEEVALTAHIVRNTTHDHDAIIDQAGIGLLNQFGINHATLQIELGHSCLHDQHDHAPHF